MVLRIEGRHLVTHWARRTFAQEAVDNAVLPDVTLRLMESDTPRMGSGCGGQQVGQRPFSFRGRRYTIVVERDGRGKLLAEFFPHERHHPLMAVLRDPLEAWKLWLSHAAPLSLHLIKDFTQAQAPKIVQSALLEHDASLIHASGVEADGNGILFAAWGGIGKSLLMTRAVSQGAANFLCDDHGIVDAAGRMHPNLLPMHLYRYHTAHPPLRERMLATLSPASRWQWALGHRLKPKRAVRWVSPVDLFGQNRIAPLGPDPRGDRDVPRRRRCPKRRLRLGAVKPRRRRPPLHPGGLR